MFSSECSLCETYNVSVTLDMSCASPNLYKEVMGTLHRGQLEEYYVHPTMHSRQNKCEQLLGLVRSDTDSRQMLQSTLLLWCLRGFYGVRSYSFFSMGMRLRRLRFLCELLRWILSTLTLTISYERAVSFLGPFKGRPLSGVWMINFL